MIETRATLTEMGTPVANFLRAHTVPNPVFEAQLSKVLTELLLSSRDRSFSQRYDGLGAFSRVQGFDLAVVVGASIAYERFLF